MYWPARLAAALEPRRIPRFKYAPELDDGGEAAPFSRSAAMRGLTQLAKSKTLSDAQRQQIVKILVAALDTDDVCPVHRASDLPDLGHGATALPALDKMGRRNRARGQNRIKSVASRIRARLMGQPDRTR